MIINWLLDCPFLSFWYFTSTWRELDLQLHVRSQSSRGNMWQR